MNNESVITQIKEVMSNIPELKDSIFYFQKNQATDDICDLRPVENSLNMDGKTVLDLTEKKEKVLVTIDTTFFPFWFQNLSCISFFYSRIKHRSAKLYIHTVRTAKEEDSAEWEKTKSFFIKYLSDIGVEFEFLDKDKFDFIKINHFYFIPGNFSILPLRALNSKIKKYLLNYDKIPFRKVFLARKKHLVQRIDSDKAVQDFFVNAGFEVVYPEDFETFIDQINYFSECSIIAGVSGSALANSIFMKPGGTVIELSSIFKTGQTIYPTEIHHYYRIMANAMGHLYFSVSNLSGKAIDFTNNKKALDIIKML
jgi:hypothetical protein